MDFLPLEAVPLIEIRMSIILTGQWAYSQNRTIPGHKKHCFSFEIHRRYLGYGNRAQEWGKEG
jgi:hypothetical protein